MNRDKDFFLIFISFFTSLVVYRILPLNVEGIWHWDFQGISVHHFDYGIVGLAIIGYLALMGYRLGGFLSIAYGYCLFLVADEFAMWLKLTQNDKGDPLEYAGNAAISLVLVSLLIAKIRKLR